MDLELLPKEKLIKLLLDVKDTQLETISVLC